MVTDVADPSETGHDLRPRANAIADLAEPALDLIRFLWLYESEIAAAYADNAQAMILAAGARIAAITSEDESEATRWGTETDAYASRIRSDTIVRLVGASRNAPSFAEAAGVGLRLELPNSVASWQDLLQSLRGPARIASAWRQLIPLIDILSVPQDAGAPVLINASQLCTQASPLLSHRVALLVRRLVRTAAEAAPLETGRLFRAFYSRQPGRIHAAEERIGGHLQVAVASTAESDARAWAQTVSAYRNLAEGMLRPFGTLIVHLDTLARGRALPADIRPPLLGDVETQLDATRSELGELLTLGIHRPLRNADAHNDLVVSASGELSIIDDNGDVEAVDTQEFMGGYITLRAALIGADVGLGLTRWNHADLDVVPPRDGAIATEPLLRMLVEGVVAELVESGDADVSVAEGRIQIVVDGSVPRTELDELMAALEGDQFGELPIRVVDGAGNTLASRG